MADVLDSSVLCLGTLPVFPGCSVLLRLHPNLLYILCTFDFFSASSGVIFLENAAAVIVILAAAVVGGGFSDPHRDPSPKRFVLPLTGLGCNVLVA